MTLLKICLFTYYNSKFTMFQARLFKLIRHFTLGFARLCGMIMLDFIFLPWYYYIWIYAPP